MSRLINMDDNKRILNIFKETGALLEGHFILSSGQHSNRYFQCAKVLQYPEYLTAFSIMIADQFEKTRPDVVIAPAIGGIVIGYEIGRILNIETIFAERVDGKFNLRRGFEINKGKKILIIEDVITTGKSSLECSNLVNDAQAKIIGYSCIIDRSNEKPLIDKEIISQVKIQITTYNKDDLPKHLKDSKAIKPGSRKL